MTKILGIVILVLAVAVAVLPQFTNCQYEGKAITTAAGTTVPMKCLWTARAEIAVGVPLLAVGAIMMVSRRRSLKISSGIMGIVLGAFAIALPEGLIGVCSSAMPCNLVMEPALLYMGSIITTASLVGLVMAVRSKDKEL